MKPLSIMIITPLYPPAVGGAATYFGDIVPALAQRPRIDHIFVLTERLPGSPRRATDGRITVLRLLPTRLSRSQRPWLIHAATYVLTQLWFSLFLPALARRRKIDLIHFHTRYGGRHFYNALKRAGTPVIADLRDKLTDTGRLIGVADRVICCGEGVLRHSLDCGYPEEKSRLIPIAFTPPSRPSAAQLSEARRRYDLGDNPFLLYVGDITVDKGIYELVDAYLDWRGAAAGPRLIMAGVNREGERFSSLVNNTRGVQYLGHLPFSDVCSLMAAAEVMILPSRSEGLPQVILEAISLGTKVICPPSIPEFQRLLPDVSLPQVNIQAIVDKLRLVWGSDERPSYPFDAHELGLVVDRLLDAMLETIEQHGAPQNPAVGGSS